MSFSKIYFYFFMCMNVCFLVLCECMSHVVLGSQKRALDLLELGLQGLVSSPIWVLGTEFRQVLLTAKPTLQPLSEFFNAHFLRKFQA